MPARASILVAGLGLAVAACAGRATWSARPAVPQPPTRVVGGIVVATECDDLPVLTEAEVATVVELAEKRVGGQRVRRMIQSRSHPGEGPYLELQFAYHETRKRIRLFLSVEAYLTSVEREGDGGGEWKVETEVKPWLSAEICAPGRSFLDGRPIPATDVVKVFVGDDMTAGETVEIVDAVYDHVPPGEKLLSIDEVDAGVYEVMTENAEVLRPLSGHSLHVWREHAGWKVEVIGEWVS